MPRKNYKKLYKLYTKRASVSMLILLTACTNSNINTTNNSQSVINSSKDNTSKGNDKQENNQNNQYNLPTLGIESQKKDDKKENYKDYSLDLSEQKIADPRNSKTRDANDLENMGYGLLNSTASDEMQDWFASKRITSEISISANDDGMRNFSFDLLKPIFETDDDIVFTQLGFRRSNRYTEDYRNTINLGLGYRHIYEKSLIGVNTFYDSDITGHNNRLGLGLEAWADYIKLSANSYIRLSDWKKSVDMDDYMERPANGWDIRTEAYLPQYPQLGGKFVYEQYYGDNVGLFGSSNRQKDPNAATIGLSYTPIPLITLSTDYRQGKDRESDTTLKLALNLQLGVSLKKQLSPDEIRSSRLLNNIKYNLVNRNNEIVMDYRKNELGTITLPLNINTGPNVTLSIPVTFTGGVRNVTWTGTAAQYALPYGGGPTASVLIPVYNVNGVNTYTLQAIGTDEYGHLVKSNITQIVVTANQLTMTTSQPTTIANGSDFIIFTATLKQHSGAAVANSAVVWSIQGNADIIEQSNQTDSNGVATLKLSSKSANLVKVTVREPSGQEINSDVTFTADTSSAKVTELTVDQNTVLANGVSFVTVTATLKDANGNPVPANTPVTWSSTAGQLSNTSSVTDANGIATITFKTTTSGAINVTATAAQGNATVTINALPDSSTAKIVTITPSATNVVANSGNSVITVTVHDVNGNPVPANTPVGWTTSLGTLSAPLTYTDANGIATVTLSSTTIGVANIVATAAQGSMNTNVTFGIDSTTLAPINLTNSSITAIADDIDTISFAVDVQDIYGNKAPANTIVNWSTNLGTLGSLTSITDVNGKAFMTLKSNIAGIANVVASSGVGSVSTNITFTSNITSHVVSVISTQPVVVASNSTSTTLRATVLDINNQPVENATVNWTSSLGSLSQSTSTTNAAGIAEITLSSLTAGTATISATAETGTAQTTTVVFEADPTTAELATVSSSVQSAEISSDPASATPVALYATITDSNGNRLGAGITVNWSTSSFNFFSMDDFSQSTSSITDSNGQATIPFYMFAPGQQIINVEYNGIIKNITVIGNAPIVTPQPFEIETTLNVGVSNSIEIPLDKSILPIGYDVKFNCSSLCQDINGNDIFDPSTVQIIGDKLKIQSINMGQTGIITFTVQINDGPIVSYSVEVYPPPV
jgi:adhesin/invasin